MVFRSTLVIAVVIGVVDLLVIGVLLIIRLFGAAGDASRKKGKIKRRKEEEEEEEKGELEYLVWTTLRR